MKVALTVWEDRISPVFDSARTLLIAEITDNEIVSRHFETFMPEMTVRLAGSLKNLHIDVLICGAISQFPAGIIENAGIELIPFVSGNAEDVLVSYANEIQMVPAFSMPGCGWRHGQKNGRKEFFNHQKEVRMMPGGNKKVPQRGGAGTGKGRGGCSSGKGGRNPDQGCGRRSGKGRGSGQGAGKDRENKE